MPQQFKTSEDMKMVSNAVADWYRHYKLPPSHRVSQFLCDAAINHFHDGCRSSVELTAWLIGKFVGETATMVNAPTSISIH